MKAVPTSGALGSTMEIRRAGLHVRRGVSLAGPDLLRVAQQIDVRGRRPGLDVSGPFWIFGLVRILRGRVRYTNGDEFIFPRRRTYGIFLPPQSILRAELVRSRTFSVGFLGRSEIPPGIPRVPVLFDPPSGRLPKSRAQVFSLLRRGQCFRKITGGNAPSSPVARLKGALDRFYASSLSLGRLVRAVDLSPAVASRGFRKQYGISPSQYRQSLRVLEGMMRLAEGQPIIDVSSEVGFGDLSRFYRHFRRIACAPPGRYHPRRSKIAKTDSSNSR